MDISYLKEKSKENISIWKKIDNHFEEYTLAVLIILMTIGEVVNAIFSISNSSLAGLPEEISIFFYVWICFLSVSYCAKHGCDVVVNMLSSKYNKTIQKLLILFQYIVGMIISMAFLYGSIIFVKETYLSGLAGEISKIPLYIVYMAPVIGYFCCVIRNIQAIIKWFNKKVI